VLPFSDFVVFARSELKTLSTPKEEQAKRQQSHGGPSDEADAVDAVRARASSLDQISPHYLKQIAGE
jgi:hypothetical protein